jgi:hypothetical protein
MEFKMSLNVLNALRAYEVSDPEMNASPINLEGKVAIALFFCETGPKNVSVFACGADLSKLIDLAREVDDMFTNIPPYFAEKEDLEVFQKEGKAFIIERVTRAIQEKQQYYSTTFFGRIKHALLSFIGYCDPAGNPPSIQNARVFVAKVQADLNKY